MRHRVVWLGGCLAALVLAACEQTSSRTPASPTNRVAGTFTLTDAGCQYDGRSHFSTGPMSTDVTNLTSDRAHFDFWKVDVGHTYAEFAAYVSEAGRRLRSSEPELGHPTFASLVSSIVVDSKATKTLSASLTAGSYGMACIRWKVSEDRPIDMSPAGPLNTA